MTGPATVKICVLDNWTDEQRTGVMTVTDMATGKSTSVDLRQKCNTDYGTRAGNLVTPEKGNIIYGVGYGYNVTKKPGLEAIASNPIIKCLFILICFKVIYFPIYKYRYFEENKLTLQQ